MSDKMRPIPFNHLLWQSVTEYKEKGTLFYVPVVGIDANQKKVILSGKAVESPIGPAAGPHTQLAQNIIAAYAGGARYFELKTVQVLDGESLGIQKPCIYVKGEAYNTEWSSELTAYEALEEYVKAWFLLKLLIKEFELGDLDGFVFNMSVGYNLEGIQSEKIDYFIEHMKEAKETKIWNECAQETIKNLEWFTKVSKEYVETIDSKICNTITLSTMHGCPVEDIERITTYLLEQKKLNTYLKCNPTLLGLEQVRNILDVSGYEYVTFDKEVFEQDITFEAAVDLIKRLKLVGKENQVDFGIKLTNTFPVKIKKNELQGRDMYMSGAALYPLSIGVAAKLSKALGSEMLISYSGGADENNIGAIYETGICPITVSTILLKNRGYMNLTTLNQTLANCDSMESGIIQIEKLEKLAKKAVADINYHKVQEKQKKKIPLEYTPYCSVCKNCVDVCPNRANYRLVKGEKKYTLHNDALCNECGNCAHFCILDHDPSKEKFTLFQTESDFMDSENSGVYKDKQEIILRWMGTIYRGATEEHKEVPDDIKDLIKELI